jgi:hypothetical protein
VSTPTNTPSPTRQALDELRRRFAAARQRAVARESRWSWTRLAVFALGLAAWPLCGGRPWLAAPLIALAVVGFIYAVRRHLAARAAREFDDRLLLVTDEALRRCDGHVVGVRSGQRPADDADTDRRLPVVIARGPTWTLTDQERDDLDLYSPPVGLFGLLNRTSTGLGARRLRDALEQPSLSGSHIAARQTLVRWLATHHEQRLRLMAALAEARREDEHVTRLIRAVDDARPLPRALPPRLLLAWSLISSGLTAFALARASIGDFMWALVLLGLLVLNGLLAWPSRAAVRGALAAWDEAAWATRAYLGAARQAATDLPTDTQLAFLRGAAAKVAAPALLPRLQRRLRWTERGGAFWELLNLVAFVDTHVARGLLNCVVPNRDALLLGLSALAELDALSSLACFAAEQPVTCYPTPAGDPRLTLTAGRHPLVPPERVVPNDVELSATTRLWVITGSNMAGKSTFLRMVGVNVLLAQLGGVVTAREMRWSPVRLVTDLRARDNLAGNESYFLAEVRHLRRMVNPPAGDVPILGLIDEPFRGTNSRDQSAASIAVVRHLLTGPHLFLLATHDQHLTALADGVTARNWHFRENLSDTTLVFDYRLHEGPAQTRNALRILALEGYPATLVAHAQDWLRQTGAGPDA